MEKLEKYRSLVRQLLNNHTLEEANQSNSEIECQLIFDTEHDHYQLLDIGLDGLKRVYNCFMHIDIKSKIWIQRNMTEADLAQDLVEMGIPKEDIILGLHPSYKRPYTGYGVASVRSLSLSLSSSNAVCDWYNRR